MTTGTPSVFLSVAQTVRGLLERSRVPGVAIGIVSGEETYLGGFGMTNIEEPAPITPDTLFRVASITKLITATAVMRLVDMGKLEVDAPVRRYITDLQLDSPAVTEEVTLRHLFTHTLGLAAPPPKVDHSDSALKAYVSALSETRRVFALGESWSYGNVGSAVAGRVIELVTGKIFDAAVRELVLDPLGMEHSVFIAEEAVSYTTAAPHILTDAGASVLHRRGVRGSPSPTPASGLFSTARDLLKFARFHLGDGTTERGERLMSRESLEFMRQPQTAGGSHGIAWFRERTRLPGQVGHTGGAPGFLSELSIIPSRRFAVVVLTNAAPPNDGLLAYRAMGIMDSGGPLGLVGWAAAVFAETREPADVELSMTDEQLAGYVGSYSGWDDIDVRAEGRRLSLLLHATDPSLSARTTAALYGGDRIRLLDGPGEGARGEFLRGPDRTVTGLRLPVFVMQRQH